MASGAGNVPGARSSRASNGRRGRRSVGELLVLAYDEALVGISEEVLDGLSGDGPLEEELLAVFGRLFGFYGRDRGLSRSFVSEAVVNARQYPVTHDGEGADAREARLRDGYGGRPAGDRRGTRDHLYRGGLNRTNSDGSELGARKSRVDHRAQGMDLFWGVSATCAG
ncbi:MAG TPA: hypothetical protein VFH32_00860 [Rubrobacteraceae bacterium]|nr:hypothetical protein [Rubrobacteraceae bacterium]